MFWGVRQMSTMTRADANAKAHDFAELILTKLVIFSEQMAPGGALIPPRAMTGSRAGCICKTVTDLIYDQ